MSAKDYKSQNIKHLFVTETDSPLASLHKVELKGETGTSWMHNFFEIWILFRWQSIKNNPRANYLIFRSFMSVLVVFLLMFLVWSMFFCCIGNFLDCMTGFEYFSKHKNDFLKYAVEPKRVGRIIFYFFGSVSVLFWNMTNLYNRKWQYCCGLYNDILKEKFGTKRDALRNALALDLLKLDFWAHASFKELFVKELERSISNSNYPDACKESLFKKVSFGNLSENEASYLLNKMQLCLLEKQKNEEESGVIKLDSKYEVEKFKEKINREEWNKIQDRKEGICEGFAVRRYKRDTSVENITVAYPQEFESLFEDK